MALRRCQKPMDAAKDENFEREEEYSLTASANGGSSIFIIPNTGQSVFRVWGDLPLETAFCSKPLSQTQQRQEENDKLECWTQHISETGFVASPDEYVWVDERTSMSSEPRAALVSIEVAALEARA